MDYTVYSIVIDINIPISMQSDIRIGTPLATMYVCMYKYCVYKGDGAFT